MLYSYFLAGLVAAGMTSAVPITTSPSSASSIWVTQVPTSVRPYAIAHYNAGGCIVGQQYYRFPVTGLSSNNAFTLISTNAPGSTDLGVLPHTHQIHYENFFSFRGRFQLWANKDGVDTTRILLPGDYGAVPQNTTHTFQILDEDTEMLGVIQPGGFEKLFYALSASNFTTSTTPYDPSIPFSSASPPASVLAQLQSFDVFAQFQYAPGPVPATAAATWHNASNTLAADSKTPYVVAANFGPKYLNSVNGYQVIAPLVTPTQSGGNYTMSTISLGNSPGNATVATKEEVQALTYPGHAAFEVLEGNLLVTMLGETVSLSSGDVVFIPGNTTFAYKSGVPFTKALYVSQGAAGLDTALIKAGKSWGSPVWPAS